MTRTRRALVVGFIAKSPVSGMAHYNLHYIRGLKELGYDIHYVERLNVPDECYDPSTNTFGDDVTYGLRWLMHCMDRFPTVACPWTVIDRNGTHLGAGPDILHAAIERADFVLTLADPTWFDELERCPRRLFVDGDPLFTQAAMLDVESPTSRALAQYPELATYWTRQSASDTTVPAADRRWISTTPVVATSLWTVEPPQPDAALTTVMNWGAWGDVEVGGQLYGHKSREFERFVNIPTMTSRRFRLAVGGPAPKARLLEAGWDLANPLDVTGTFEAYRIFIRDSFADLGICKHAYVASKSGWFSDRSLCYLASGRPVLHQDTGFTDWLDVSLGVLPFADPDSLLAAIERLAGDYTAHSKAAREVAETHFEARTVIGRMLDDAGFR